MTSKGHEERRGILRRRSATLLALAAVAGNTLAACGGAVEEDTDDIAVGRNEIVGGTEAQPGAWPAVVSVVYSQSPVWPWWCGGTIIAPGWVLTAAHCVFDDANTSRYEVYVGRHNISSSDGQVVGVSEIRIHPSYDGNTENGYDLALLKLQTSVSEAPSRLVSPGRMSEIGPGDDTTILGWGNTSWGGSPSTTLQTVTLGIVGTGSACDAATDYSGVVEHQICIGTLAGGQDSCQGDSGGPAYIRRDSEWFLLGVTSWGWGCALPNRPGVYELVPEHFDWVLSNADGSPSPSLLPSAQIIAIAT